MAVNLPPNSGERPTTSQPTGSWAPTYPTPPTPRSAPGRAGVLIAVALGALAILLAATALIVTLMHSNQRTTTPTTTSTHTHTAAEIAAADRQLCDTYKLAARAVEIDTGGGDRALARIATTNGAVMLDNAAADTALDAKYRDAARSLAAAYGKLTAMSNNVVATDMQYQAALDDITAKDAVMRNACGGN